MRRETAKEIAIGNKIFSSKTVRELFDALRPHLERAPTSAELRTWTNTVLGPYDIPQDVLSECSPRA